MKKSILTSILCLTAITALAAKLPKAPAALRAGDKIAILSPASTPGDSTIPDRAAAVLRQWGFDPVVSPNAMNRHHIYAGTIAQRRNDLLKALRDPEVKAIITTRGGYGSAMLIDAEVLKTMKQHPKWIIGYSDITSLHSAQVCAGNMSIHANMCGALAGKGANDSINLMLRDVLQGKRPTYTVPAHPYNKVGQASGILLGGNMSVFTVNLSGSKQADFLDRDRIKGRDIILFFEDVSEAMPRVNSMLTDLRLKGVLDRVKGIVIGRFTDYTPGYGYESMNQMLQEYLAGYNIPICYDFPASHDESWNYPLIEGCPATLSVNPASVTLQFK